MTRLNAAIFLPGQHPQVSRVHTCSVEAEMVDHHSEGNRTLGEFVRVAMRGHVSPAGHEDSPISLKQPTRPIPAILRLRHKPPESLLFGGAEVFIRRLDVTSLPLLPVRIAHAPGDIGTVAAFDHAETFGKEAFVSHAGQFTEPPQPGRRRSR